MPVGFMVVGFIAQLLHRDPRLPRALGDDADAPGRQGDGRRLLRLRLGRHVRDLPRRAGFTAGIHFDAYMPVMLAVMEIPGCLWLCISSRGSAGMGWIPQGNMPDEPGYDPWPRRSCTGRRHGHGIDRGSGRRAREGDRLWRKWSTTTGSHSLPTRSTSFLSPQLLHEVFLNPGLVLLFGGILIGFVSGLQGKGVTGPTTTSSSPCSRASSACSCWRWG